MNDFEDKNNRSQNIENINEKKDTKKIEHIYNRKKFLCFILFVFSCGKKNNYFKIYKEFRIKIISEEHLIKNHLKIYNLLRITKRKKNGARRNSYELKDLIGLV